LTFCNVEVNGACVAFSLNCHNDNEYIENKFGLILNSGRIDKSVPYNMQNGQKSNFYFKNLARLYIDEIYIVFSSFFYTMHKL
jgi:hypothetical protein